jgi:hypothetical protein
MQRRAKRVQILRTTHCDFIVEVTGIFREISNTTDYSEGANARDAPNGTLFQQSIITGCDSWRGKIQRKIRLISIYKLQATGSAEGHVTGYFLTPPLVWL